VDSRKIIATMNYFSNWEFIEGISAHYFVSTHYFKDSNMSAYFEEANYEKIQELLERNHTIGSHSVGHFPDFYKSSVFPIGEPGNTQFSYQPIYNGNSTVGGTVYGELEVSRDLLNNEIGANVRSFRAGALSFNTHLTNVMEELDYSFNSSMSANNVLTNFPYLERTDKAFKGATTKVLEIPLTLTDISSQNKLNENNVDELVNTWSDVISRNNENNAPTTLLISPNREWKIGALQGLISNLPLGVITYNFEDFGDYWLDRNSLDFDYSIENNKLTIILKQESLPALDLSMVINNGVTLDEILVFNSLGEKITFYTKAWKTNELLVTFEAPKQAIREKHTAKIDVQSLVEESSIQVFPNPAKNYINLLFDLTEKEEYSIRICDLSGRLILSYDGISSQGSTMQRVDLTGFRRGLYLMQFKSESEEKTIKFSVID